MRLSTCVALALLAVGCSKKSAQTDNEGQPQAAAQAENDHGHEHPDPVTGLKAEASVAFVYPHSGSTVFATTDYRVGSYGLPKGHNGHFHILIDTPALAAGTMIPADANHIHLEAGHDSAALKLSPGEHTLTVQYGDAEHKALDLSQTLKVTAVPDPAEERKVFFANLKEGDRVKSPFKVQFGLSGMRLVPAGEEPMNKTSGHHHIIIDSDPAELGTVVPADDKHIHFGKAQTETELTLEPGEHTLTLQFADGAHLSYGPRLSDRIRITVE